MNQWKHKRSACNWVRRSAMIHHDGIFFHNKEYVGVIKLRVIKCIKLVLLY